MIGVETKKMDGDWAGRLKTDVIERGCMTLAISLNSL